MQGFANGQVLFYESRYVPDPTKALLLKAQQTLTILIDRPKAFPQSPANEARECLTGRQYARRVEGPCFVMRRCFLIAEHRDGQTARCADQPGTNFAAIASASFWPREPVECRRIHLQPRGHGMARSLPWCISKPNGGSERESANRCA